MLTRLAAVVCVVLPFLTLADDGVPAPDQVLARVNGTPLHLAEVCDAYTLQQRPAELRRDYLQQQLQAAIDAELLVQAARQRKLDQSPAYAQRLALAERHQRRRRAEIMANRFELQAPALVAARDPAAIDAEALAAAVAEQQTRLARLTPEAQQARVRDELIRARYLPVYASWLATQCQRVPVLVADKPLSSELLAAAAELACGVRKATGEPGLWGAALASAGIDELTFETNAEGVESLTAGALQRLEAFVLTIGQDSIGWRDDARLESLVLERDPDPAARNLRFFEILKPYLVAEAARRDGFAERPEEANFVSALLQAEQSAGDSDFGPPLTTDRRLLIALLLEMKPTGRVSPDQTPEVESFVSAYLERHRHRGDKPGEVQAQRQRALQMYRQRQSQLQQRRLVQDLRDSAQIEILGE